MSKDFPSKPDRWKPSIWTFDLEGTSFLVKDIRSTSILYRYFWARLGIWREAANYRRLRGMEGIPRYMGKLDSDALVFEKVEGVPLHRDAQDRIGPDFFRKLEAFIRELHQRGMVHLDLRQKRNILVSQEGKPWVLDFAGSIYVGKGWLGQKLLLPMFAWIDRSAVTKYRVRYFPQWSSPEEIKRDRFFRKLRKLWIFSRHKKRKAYEGDTRRSS